MDTIRWRKPFFHSDRRWFYENGRSSAAGAAVSPRTAPMSGRCTRCLPIFSARRTGTCRGRLCASLRRAYCEETYCPERDCRYILAACAALPERVCAAGRAADANGSGKPKISCGKACPCARAGLSAMVMDELSRGWGYASSRFLLPTTAAAARPDTPSAATHSITPRSPVEGLSGFVG